MKVLAYLLSVLIACSCQMVHQSEHLSSQATQRGTLPVERGTDQSSPTVSFNHLYVVVPDEVIKQFSASGILRDLLAASDQGFPKFLPVESGSQNIYLRGENTYLEVFGPDNRFGKPLGELGLAFSTEIAGEIDAVGKRLREVASRQHNDKSLRLPVDWQRHLGKWDFDREPPVNWYHVIYRTFKAGARCVWWFSEYHPDFLPALYPHRPTGETGIKRSHFLAGRHDATRWLRDIVALVVVLESDVADELAEDLLAVGWTIDDRKDGGRSLSSGHGFQIVLYAQGRNMSPGLQSIEFTTYPQVDGSLEEEFPGGVTLRLDGSTLGWIDFAPQE